MMGKGLIRALLLDALTLAALLACWFKLWGFL
jgi:hypothetical protein